MAGTTSYIIGIDPGINGGIIWLPTDNGGSQLYNAVMPTIKVVKQRGKKKIITRVVDPAATGRLLQQVVKPYLVQAAYVENVHAMPDQGVSSTFEFGRGYGIVLGALGAIDIDTLLVPPQTWKRYILGPGKHTKRASADYCHKVPALASLQLVPKGKRVPHDGLADAACIALYGQHDWISRKLVNANGSVLTAAA